MITNHSLDDAASRPSGSGSNARLLGQSTPPHGGGAEGSAPPGRPLQPVTVSYASAWMHFLIFLCLAVAWYFPVKFAVSRWLWPKVELGPRVSSSFVALAYEGVSTRTNEVSSDVFNEHLQALRRHGYVPISLQDVRGLMFEGKPVPRKAVLLTFDHGRKTSYYAVDTLLRRAGWKAVMFLWTRPIMEGDSAALLWPYVRIMARSGVWELGAQSNNGFAPVAASPRGHLGHFMTTPAWLAGENRFETPVEFDARLNQDHVTCRTIIERKAGVKPIAYAYPYGDFGQFESRNLFARRLNLNLTGKYYALGFLSGNLAANTRYSDPRRLNRVRVKPEWSGEELVAFLDRTWPQEEAKPSGIASRMASAWIVDWGSMKEENGRMTLYAPEQITGAKMWLAGSDLAKDFYSRITFSDLNGQLGIYVRAAPDEESYVYLGVDSKGTIWLRQKRLGQAVSRLDEDENKEMSFWLRQKHVSLERFTLNSSRLNVEPGQTHYLDVYVRGSLLYALLDGQPIFHERVVLRGETKRGMLGLSVWSPEKGRARVAVSEVLLKKQEPLLATWNTTGKLEPAVFHWIHQNSSHITDLSPPWMSFSPSGQLIKSGWDASTYRMLARMYELRLLPRILVNDERAFSRLAPSQMADKAEEMHADGIFLHLADLKNTPLVKISTWLQQCSAALKEKGQSLLVQLPESLERTTFLHSMLAVAPNLQVVTAPESPLRKQIAKDPKLSATQMERVPEPDPEKDLPMFYEITSVPETTAGEAPAEVKGSRLQQEGQAAFLDADYQKAIALWKQWLSLEPNNPRAPMLIGDAYLRLGDFKQAISNYNLSLDLDPGRIRLALRRAGLLDTMGRSDEAMSSLNMYARLFPDNADVLLGQAEWLRRHNRAAEAIPLVKRLAGLDTNNFEATALMLRLPISPAEFNVYMQNLVKLGAQPANYYDLGQAIWKYDLLSLPGSHPLVKLVRHVSTQTRDARVAAIFDRLKQRPETVTDIFATGKISEAWWMDGGVFEPEAGKLLRMRTDESHTEATLHLLGSEHYRDAFVEATLQRKSGMFWLYARRTSDHFVRFGVDDTGRLLLQVWRNDRLLDTKTSSWNEPKTAVRLRLEVRGNGLMGYVDGQPAFSTPLTIPSSDYELGWVGLSTYSAERGKAEALLERASAGPLAMRLALLPGAQSESESDALLGVLRPEITLLTDLAPHWFRVNAEGAWSNQIGNDEKLLLLFARYYRIRLMPVVEVAADAKLSGGELISAAEKHKADGFVLLFDSLPDTAWFTRLEAELGACNLKILAMALNADQSKASVRSLAAGSDLLLGAEDIQDMLYQPWTGKDGKHQPLSELPANKPVLLPLYNPPEPAAAPASATTDTNTVVKTVEE